MSCPIQPTTREFTRDASSPTTRKEPDGKITYETRINEKSETSKNPSRDAQNTTARQEAMTKSKTKKNWSARLVELQKLKLKIHAEYLSHLSLNPDEYEANE